MRCLWEKPNAHNKTAADYYAAARYMYLERFCTWRLYIANLLSIQTLLHARLAREGNSDLGMGLACHRRLLRAYIILIDGSSRRTAKSWGLVACVILSIVSLEIGQPTQIMESALLYVDRVRAKGDAIRSFRQGYEY